MENRGTEQSIQETYSHNSPARITVEIRHNDQTHNGVARVDKSRYDYALRVANDRVESPWNETIRNADAPSMTLGNEVGDFCFNLPENRIPLVPFFDQ